MNASFLSRMRRSDDTANLDRLAAAGKPVAFVCRSGSRSAMATRQARQAGIDAHNVSGGMLAWERQGLPVESGD